MKTKYFLFILLLMVLSMPSVAYAQCADIFKQGVALMEAKKYKSAISYFQKAKKCDNNLAKQCDEKISECRKLINPTPIATKSYVITLNPETLEFGSEETAYQSIKVKSDIDWECSSDADWCEVFKKNNEQLSVRCDINKSANDRNTKVRISNGKDSKFINIVQEGVDIIFDVIPEQIHAMKEGEILELPLNCNTDYVVEFKPEWVNVRYQGHDMMIIKVDAYKFSKKEEKREDVLIVKTPDGKIDRIKITQWKKKPQMVENTVDKQNVENTNDGNKSKNEKRPKNLQEYRKMKNNQL